MSDLRFEKHFQIYELQLFDIVELLPTQEQERDLNDLIGRESDLYRFVTATQITSLGIDTSSGMLYETIGDQTEATIQENEASLMKVPGVGKTYGPIAL